MDPLTAPSRIATLITALVQTADTHGDADTLLHEDVTLQRLDETMITGRAAVADAIRTHGDDARFEVVGSLGDSVYVALRVKDVPGRLVFTMTGEMTDGMLVAIRMTLEAPEA